MTHVTLCINTRMAGAIAMNMATRNQIWLQWVEEREILRKSCAVMRRRPKSTVRATFM
jgi:hypothetical protein